MKKLLLSAITVAAVTIAANAADETVYEIVKAFNPNERTATQGKDGQTPPRWYSFDNLGTTPDDVFSLAGRDIENLRLEFDLYVEYTGSEPDVTFAGLPWGTKNSNNDPIYSPFLSIDGDNGAKINFSDHGRAAKYAETYLKNVKEGWNHMEIDFNNDQLSEGTDLETSTFKKVTMNFARVLNTDFIIKSNNFKITDRSNKVIFEQISGDSFVGLNFDDANLTTSDHSVEMPVYDGNLTTNKGINWFFKFSPSVDASEYETKNIYFEFDFNIESEDPDLKDFVKESSKIHYDHGQLELLNAAKPDNYEINYRPVDIHFKAGANTYRIALNMFGLNNSEQPFDYGNIAYGRMYMYFWSVDTPFKATMSNPRIMVRKIVPIENINTGINDIVTEDANAPVEYFNLQGVRVANPESGLYIRRQGNKVTKVLVK